MNPKTLSQKIFDLRKILNDLLEEWHRMGLPARAAVIQRAKEILHWKAAQNIEGLWPDAPLLVTATLDDGFGQGLEIIHLYAEVVGLRTHFLGLLQKPDAVLAACRRLKPDFLGLTVLQFDTEDALRTIRGKLPVKTRLIAGGPLFKADPEFAVRTGIDFAADNVADLLVYLLEDTPCD
jgi:hypothetical protein